jgi:hypothetical protein
MVKLGSGTAMTCLSEFAAHDLMSLRDGTLSVTGRFRLARHVRACGRCRVSLLILAEAVAESVAHAACDVRAVAVLADVDPTKASEWLSAMFTRN